jgi:hypothetical protein
MRTAIGTAMARIQARFNKIYSMATKPRFFPSNLSRLVMSKFEIKRKAKTRIAAKKGP